MTNAFSSEPLASATEATSPRIMSEKYSAGPNSSATSAKGGAAMARIRVATEPAKNEPSAAVARACPARPWRAIWEPSNRSDEGRVGEEGRSWGLPDDLKKKLYIST